MPAAKGKKRCKVPPAPAALPPEARALWRKLAPGLRSSGRLRDEQLGAFELLCTHYALARLAARQIARDGPSTKDERGLIRKHPAHQVLRENSEQFRQFSDRFGLTPKSRSKIVTREGPAKTLAQVLQDKFDGIEEDDDGNG